MFGISAAAVAAIGAAASVGVAVYNGQQQASAQKKALAQAQNNAQAQATAADQAMNKASQKTPDTRNSIDAAMSAGRGGQSGTMLTGASGIDPSSLSLGKSTLLGQ